MTTLDKQLRAARALIDTPEKWCQGASAKTAEGWSTEWTSDDAACFCMSGACWRALRGDIPTFVEVRSALYEVMGQWSLVGYNDTPGRTHAEVLAAFDRAIAAEQAKESSPVP